MPPVGIESTITASERSQTRPIDRLATWMIIPPITYNYHSHQYVGVCVCVVLCKRLCVGAHGGISTHISLRKSLSFLARPRVTPSPNHSNGATI